MQLGLLKYDVKVLLALQQAFTGKDDFFNWLVNAGYPELAAFCNFIQEDEDAEAWLVKHGYHWLGLLSHAIDGEDAARAWVLKNLHRANFMFCMACRKDEVAISWLKQMKLEILLRLAKEVADIRKKQESDAAFPYKMRF
ncbi:MAG: hypothetical protein J5526_06405 [Bacteroidales bacterium]|nr:hypothetical protein [Bacteroidales bacterium]